MKKLMIAAMFLFCISGTVLAQTAPKQEPQKKESKTKTTTKTGMSKHHHHAKKSDKKTGSKQG
jgi:hypothetical protein